MEKIRQTGRRKSSRSRFSVNRSQSMTLMNRQNVCSILILDKETIPEIREYGSKDPSCRGGNEGNARQCSGEPRKGSSVMLEELRTQPGLRRPPSDTALNPFNNPFYGASSGFIQDGVGEYSERIFGTGTEYVQSNISKYFSDPQYYFRVNDQYVRNKLKVILLPFLHRGHWTRIAEQVAGGLTYKPPIYDINAPDLYIPFMAFGTHVVVSGLAMGLLGKFSPEALSFQFSKGLLGWFAQVLLLRFLLYALGSGEAPILDTVAYGGYAFAGIALSVLARIVWSYSYYVVMPWTCVCMAVFLVKTMKRVLFAEARSYDRDSSRHHYLLLFIAIAQFPLFLWLGHITA